MARYDREFLVPYLEDICALHLSKQRLNGMILASRDETSRINLTALRSVTAPKLEKYKTDTDGVGLGGGFVGVLCLLAVVPSVFAALIFDMSILIVSLILLVIGMTMSSRYRDAKDVVNAEIKERNDEKEREHALAEMAALIAVKPQVEAVERRIKVYEEEIRKVDMLLEQLYSVNVIPRWYRDLYPAVYLYDWFSNSRADDLDMALNTLVLEQIKDRLDAIIRNQSEMIINQRIMIANQRQCMEQAERHHQMLLSKLDRIGASVEDQKMYLSMIEANTAANVYFSAANYLKS